MDEAPSARAAGLRRAARGGRLRRPRIQAAAETQSRPGGPADPPGRAAGRRRASVRPGDPAQPGRQGAREAAHQPRYPQGRVALHRNAVARHARVLGTVGSRARGSRERAVHRRDRVGPDPRVDRRAARARDHGQGLHRACLDQRAPLPEPAGYRLVQDRLCPEGTRPVPEPVLHHRQRHGCGARGTAGQRPARHPPRHAAGVRG